MNTTKKRTFHWGHGLLVFFTFYISYLVFIVIKSRTVDNTLVMDNYYSHDLAYQAHYDQITNRSLLVHDLNFVVDAEHNSITLDFGDDTPIVSAQLNFYRASDAALDFKLELKEISDKVTLSTADMEPGKWTLKVTWNDGHRDYFKSKELIIRRA